MIVSFLRGFFFSFPCRDLRPSPFIFRGQIPFPTPIHTDEVPYTAAVIYTRQAPFFV